MRPIKRTTSHAILLCAALFGCPQLALAQFTQQGPKLVGSGAVGVPFQADSVTLSAGGNTTVVGGSGDNKGPGAAWVFAQARMDGIQSTGRIIAGISFDIPGMGYRDPGTGLIEGFEADLARAIAKELLGAPDRVDFFQVTDAQRISVLQNDLVDMVLSQMTITPDRAEQVDFSIPYLITREAILVPKGSSIKSFDDLKGKRIAVTADSISLRRMRASLPSLPGATLIVTPLSSGNLEAVAKGEADAASNDLLNLTLLRRASNHPDRYDIIDIGDRFEQKPFGVAVRKGNQSLLDRLNEAINILKANGDIDRLLTKNIAGVTGSAERP
jgi:ABC-type amino acid transport substrate-binding protein